MNNSSSIFDEALYKIEHYQRFPVMMPFIGKNYDSKENKRIMLIGESHYLPQGSTVSVDSQNWYEFHQDNLNQQEFEWINTRRILSSEWTSPGHMIFRELEIRMSDFYDTSSARAMSNVVFMNGFQRPAPEKGNSIKQFAQPIDFEVGAHTIERVIEILNPNLVLFVSKFAWWKLRSRLSQSTKDKKFEFTCHPGTGGRYWHNTFYPHGKEKFKRLIGEYTT